MSRNHYRNMMLLSILVTLAFVAAGLLTATSARSATACDTDSPGVVTQAEYGQATLGMTRDQVTCLFGTAGFNAHFVGNDMTKGVVDYRFRDGRIAHLEYDLKSPDNQVLIDKYITAAPTKAATVTHTRPPLPRILRHELAQEDGVNGWWNDGSGHPFYSFGAPYVGKDGDTHGRVVCHLYMTRSIHGSIATLCQHR